MKTPRLLSFLTVLSTVMLPATWAKGQDSLRMTCFVHGPDMMTLEFLREDGEARDIEIIGGGNVSKWTVKIDGTDVTPEPQTLTNPGQVRLHDEDRITWKVEGFAHGLLFATKQEAEALFEFDTNEGQPLDDRARLPDFNWGTESFGPGTTLAVATVRPAVLDPDHTMPLVGAPDVDHVGVFIGVSENESFDEAYKKAVEAAVKALDDPNRTDEHYVFEVFKISGERGTIAGLSQLKVMILAEVK